MNTSSFWFEGASGPDPAPPGTSNSLRFRGLLSQYMTRTFNTPDGYLPVWTVSYWVKWGDQLNHNAMFGDITSSDGQFPAGATGVTFSSNSVLVNTRQVSAISATFPGNPTFSDYSAWYHYVWSYDGSYLKAYVNGVQYMNDSTFSAAQLNWCNSTWNQVGGTAIPSDLGPYLSLDGYLADFYNIDGQVLEPTAFGRYNEDGVWVPREVDFTPAEMRYSDMVTSSDGTFYPGTNPTMMFDGLDTTFVQTSTEAGVLTFTPIIPIEYTSSVVISSQRNAGDQAVLNGGAPVDLSAGGVPGETTLATGSGQIESLALSGYYGGSPHYIKVDGNFLLDPFLWSADLFYDAQDPSNPASDNPVNWNSTVTYDSVNINGANYAASTMFDVTGNYPQSPANNDCIIWRPSQTITANNKIEVFIANGASGFQRYYVNESYVGEYNTGSLAGTWLTLAEPGSGGAPPFPVTLETIGLKAYANSSGGFVAQVRIDGQKYINGQNPSYGAAGFHLTFEDPDNLGLDTSGNQNNFTATGFNTDPVVSPGWQTYAASWGTPYTSGLPSAIFSGEATTNYQPWNWYGPYGGETLDIGGVFQQAGVQAGDTIAFDVYPRTGSVYLNINGTDVNSTSGNAFRNFSGTVPAEGLTTCTLRGDDPVYYLVGAFYVNGVMLTNGGSPDYDLMQDGPSQNYSTGQPLYGTRQVTMQDANLRYLSAQDGTTGTIFMNSGRWYFETICQTSAGNTARGVGVVQLDNDLLNSVAGLAGGSNNANEWYFYSNGNSNQSEIGFDGAYTTIDGSVPMTDDVMKLALDMDTGEMWYGLNDDYWLEADGTQRSDFSLANPTFTGITGPVAFSPGIGANQPFNFGQQPFVFTPPAGFDNDCQTQNLPAATIRNGRDHFQAITGPGPGPNAGEANTLAGPWSQYFVRQSDPTSQDGITNIPQGFNNQTGNNLSFGANQHSMFAPTGDDVIDFTTSIEVWLNGPAGVPWGWFDNGLGVATTTPQSATTGAWTQIGVGPGQISLAQPIGGGAIGSGATLAGIRVDGNVLVDQGILPQAQSVFPNGLWWIKDMDNANQHQFVDSVNTDVYAFASNPRGRRAYQAPSGDSVAWVWDASNPSKTGFSITTGTHGLGTTPDLVINSQGYMWINTLPTTTTDTYVMWDGFAPNGTAYTNNWVITPTTVSSDQPGTYYCWRNVPGFSQIGVYQGNAESNGPFIYTGFQPAFVWMIYSGPTSGDYQYIFDTARNPYNPANLTLRWGNGAQYAEETTFGPVDFLSNGFKLRSSNFPNTAQPWAYAAFAENPFGGSNVSPATAH